MEDVIVRRRSQWTVDFRWCWRQSGRGLTWMDNCRCRGTAGAGVVSYHHERWIMIIKFFQWVPFAHSFELGWHASVLFFWVRKLAPCITCLQYSAIWVGLLQIRQEEVGKRWDKYNIYIYYIHIFISLAHSSSVFKLPPWSLLRLQRLRMAFSNSDGYEPLASPLVEQKDRTWQDIFSGVRFEFSDVQWHQSNQWLSQQHCLLLWGLFFMAWHPAGGLSGFGSHWSHRFPRVYPRCPWQLLPLCPDSKPESQSGFSKKFPVHNVLYDAIL